jgi:hypothetical protein
MTNSENLDAAIKDTEERIASARKDATDAAMREGALLDRGDRAGFRACRAVRVEAECRMERLERLKTEWVLRRKAA